MTLNTEFEDGAKMEFEIEFGVKPRYDGVRDMTG